MRLHRVKDRVKTIVKIRQHVIMIIGVAVARIQGRCRAANEYRVGHQLLQSCRRSQYPHQGAAVHSHRIVDHILIISDLIRSSFSAWSHHAGSSTLPGRSREPGPAEESRAGWCGPTSGEQCSIE